MDGGICMKKIIAVELCRKAKNVAIQFSSTQRSKNFNEETFEVDYIRPLSEYTAAVYFKKNTDKRAIAFFYYVASGDGYWQYFFPSDSHILGMSMFGSLKADIEVENWNKNFDAWKKTQNGGCEG
jgi:hypothetical protein